MVTRRLAGYAVAMEIARRPEGPEVNGHLRKTVSRRSLAPSRELKRKSYRFLVMQEMYTRLTLLRSLSRKLNPPLEYMIIHIVWMCLGVHLREVQRTA